MHLSLEEGVEIPKKKDSNAQQPDDEDEQQATGSVKRKKRSTTNGKRKRTAAGTAADVVVHASSPIVVHPRLMHFFNMLWFICRIDHILRNIAKNWMAAMSPSAQDGGGCTPQPQAEGIDVCHLFSEQNEETIASMGVMFKHAVGHVHQSLLKLRHDICVSEK